MGNFLEELKYCVLMTKILCFNEIHNALMTN